MGLVGMLCILTAFILDEFVKKFNQNTIRYNLLNVVGSGLLLYYAFSLKVDDSMNVYFTGAFQATADFNPGGGTFDLVSHGGNDVYVAKLNINGDLVWAKSIGSPLSDMGRFILLDSASNLFIIGDFTDTIDLDPGAGVLTSISSGATDVFVSKLNNNGDLIWAKSRA